MVRVPVTFENSRQRQSAGDARLRFTAARDLVGPAMQQFGRTGQQAAEVFDRIEATYDEADALRLDNELRAKVRERTITGENAYLNSRGFAAGDGAPVVQADLDKEAEALLGGARSERAKMMAQRSFQARLETAKQQIGIHAIREVETARIEQSNARISGAVTDAIDARGTDQFSVNLGLAQQELISVGNRQGWSPEKIQEEGEKLVSNAYAQTVLAIDAEDGEPTRALEFLQANRDMLLPNEEARLSAQLAPRVDAAWADQTVASGALDKYLIAAPVAAPAGTEAPAGTVADLDAITAQSESGNRDFDKNGRPITSPVGARFAMQVMPATARNPGFGLKPADPDDPADMNRLGREYRAVMEQRYGGDLAKMWAAYNAGPGRVDDAVAAAGDNWLSRMPAETRDYVAKNLKAAGEQGGRGEVGAPGIAADPRLDSRQMRQAVDKYIAENPGLPERRKQALYAAADQAVNVARADRAQAEQDADRRLQDWLTENMPGADDLTSIDKIPAAILAGTSPSTKAALQNRVQITQARAEERAARVEAGRAAQLEAEAVFELYTLSDAELATVDMRRYAGRIGMEKLGPWIDRQQNAAEKISGGGGNLVSGDRIAGRIDTLGEAFGASRALDAKPDERKLWADVRGYVEERVAGRPNKDVTDEELRSIILGGLQEAQISGTGWFGSNVGNTTMPRAQSGNRLLDLDDIPADQVAQIRDSLKRAGNPNPTTRDIFDIYQRSRIRGDTP